MFEAVFAVQSRISLGVIGPKDASSSPSSKPCCDFLYRLVKPLDLCTQKKKASQNVSLEQVKINFCEGFSSNTMCFCCEMPSNPVSLSADHYIRPLYSLSTLCYLQPWFCFFLFAANVLQIWPVAVHLQFIS